MATGDVVIQTGELTDAMNPGHCRAVIESAILLSSLESFFYRPDIDHIWTILPQLGCVLYIDMLPSSMSVNKHKRIG